VGSIGELGSKVWKSHTRLLLRNGFVRTSCSDDLRERMFRVRTPGLVYVGLVRAELQVTVKLFY
jgi:hypothetical protein